MSAKGKMKGKVIARMEHGHDFRVTVRDNTAPEILSMLVEARDRAEEERKNQGRNRFTNYN